MKIRVEYLFLPQFRMFGALMILFGFPILVVMKLPLFFTFLLWLPLAAVGVFLLLGAQRVEVDKEKRQYRSLVSVLDIFNSGKWTPFMDIESIFVKRSRESQTMALGPIQRSYRNMVFDAYLKISDREKVFLGSEKSKEKLLQKVEPLRQYLDTQLIDHSVKN